jgi:hypothetical protein
MNYKRKALERDVKKSCVNLNLWMNKNKTKEGNMFRMDRKFGAQGKRHPLRS